MKIFLAGENQKKYIIPFVHKENHEAVFSRDNKQAFASKEREREREREEI